MSERLTPERLAELRLIAEEAAKGPWRVNKYGSIGAGELGITAAVDPTTTLALLDEIERLQHEVMHLRDFLAESEAKASHLRQRYEALRSAVAEAADAIGNSAERAWKASDLSAGSFDEGRAHGLEEAEDTVRLVLEQHKPEVADDAVAR